MRSPRKDLMRRTSKRLKRSHLGSSPVAEWIGFRLVKSGKGTAVCKMKTERKHENINGAVHGGILCDLSDAAMGYAFTTLMPRGKTGVTVEFKINFLYPVYVPELLTAAARVVSRGKSLGYLECGITNSQGRLVAKASSTCKILH